MDRRTRTGIAGEDAVARWYVDRGYTLLARNWRCAIGEIDLVLGRDEILVVCEVKTRRGDSFGAGYEAVHARKRAKLRALADAFLQGSERPPGSVRFDVASVALTGARSPSPQVEVFVDAF